jgi:hypothetical protein
VGEVRKIRFGKLHTCSTEHVSVRVCANLSCNFIEWNSVYLFKTASFDSGKGLVDILPFFNNNRGITSKIIEAIIFCLLINL